MKEVVCRSCGGSYHVTNERYTPTRPTNATMLEMKEPWKSEYAWSDFPNDESIGYESLVCPACGVSYCNGAGYVVTRETDYTMPESPAPHTPIVDSYVNGTLPRNYGFLEMAQMVTTVDDGKVACDICGKLFKPGGLARHKKVAHGV